MKRMLLLVLTVSASLVLSACDTLVRRTVELPPMVTEGKFNIPSRLLEPCQRLPKLPSGEEEVVVEWFGKVKEIHEQCSLDKAALVKAIQSVK